MHRLEAELTVTTPIGTRAARDLTAGIATAHDDGDEGAAAAAARVLLATAAFEAATAGIDARHAVDLARRALCDGVLLAAEGSESLHPYRAAWTLALCDEDDEAEAALDAAASDARAHGSRLGAAAAACFSVGAARAARAPGGGRCRRAPGARQRSGGVEGRRAAGRPSAAPSSSSATSCPRPRRSSRRRASPRDSRLGRGRGPCARGRAAAHRAGQVGRGPREPASRRRRRRPGGSPPAWCSGRRLARRGRHRARPPPRRDEAARVARQGLDQARAFGAPSAIGAALRANGRVDRGADAPRLLREAVAVLRQSPARLELARTLVDLGAVLRRGNGRAAARRELRAGLELAVSCGATALAKRARAELGPSEQAGRGARCAPA